MDADFGYILCAAWKWQGNPRVYTAVISDSPSFSHDPTNDKYVVQKVRECVEEADVLVTWYGSRFDVPYINSKLLMHKLPVLPPVPHVDGWRVARNKLKLHSNRLQSVTSFLELEDKTPLNGKIWIRAMAGICRDIRYVVAHCVQDVRVLEQAYDRIKALITNHPNLALRYALNMERPLCPVCGHATLEKRGTRIAHGCIYQRYECRHCFAWSSGKSQQIRCLAR